MLQLYTEETELKDNPCNLLSVSNCKSHCSLIRTKLIRFDCGSTSLYFCHFGSLWILLCWFLCQKTVRNSKLKHLAFPSPPLGIVSRLSPPPPGAFEICPIHWNTTVQCLAKFPYQGLGIGSGEVGGGIWCQIPCTCCCRLISVLGTVKLQH